MAELLCWIASDCTGVPNKVISSHCTFRVWRVVRSQVTLEKAFRTGTWAVWESVLMRCDISELRLTLAALEGLPEISCSSSCKSETCWKYKQLSISLIIQQFFCMKCLNGFWVVRNLMRLFSLISVFVHLTC